MGRCVVKKSLSVEVKIGSWNVIGIGFESSEEDDEDSVCSISIIASSAASCHEEAAEEEFVKLPRPRHMQFVILLRVEGRISLRNSRERFWLQAEARHWGIYRFWKREM